MRQGVGGWGRQVELKAGSSSWAAAAADCYTGIVHISSSTCACPTGLTVWAQAIWW